MKHERNHQPEPSPEDMREVGDKRLSLNEALAEAEWVQGIAKRIAENPNRPTSADYELGAKELDRAREDEPGVFAPLQEAMLHRQKLKVELGPVGFAAFTGVGHELEALATSRMEKVLEDQLFPRIEADPTLSYEAAMAEGLEIIRRGLDQYEADLTAHPVIQDVFRGKDELLETTIKVYREAAEAVARRELEQL